MSDLSEMSRVLDKIENSAPDELRSRISEIQNNFTKVAGSGSAKLTLRTDSEGRLISEATAAKTTYGITVSLSFEILSPSGVYPSVSVESVDEDSTRISKENWIDSRSNEKSSSKKFSTSFWKKTKFIVSGDAGIEHADTEVQVTVFYSY